VKGGEELIEEEKKGGGQHPGGEKAKYESGPRAYHQGYDEREKEKGVKKKYSILAEPSQNALGIGGLSIVGMSAPCEGFRRTEILQKGGK